ncbi:MAG TPA: DUF2490 domain-containing protein [Vicinamibacterales bacterium]|nr:DUF2490 domain-containing protein [Vicinamibacterales bacterium]
MTSCRAALAALLITGAGVVTPAPAWAQVVTDERLWTNLSLQERQGTESPWRWSSEFVLRTREGLDEVDVVVMRGLVGYDLTERSSASVGFGLIPSFPASGGTLLEKRLFEQYLWSGRSLGGLLALRTRFEQRWAEANSGLVWRLRQQARYTRPMAPRSRYSLVVWEEIFFHANKTVRYVRGFEQNRVFGGISRTMSDRVRIDIGYLNQFSRSASGPNRLNHILSAGTVVAF